MEHARTLEVAPVAAADESPLAHARLHRQLTVDEAARRAERLARRGAVARGRPPLPLPDARPRAARDACSTRRRSASSTARRSSSPACPSPPLPFVANPWRRSARSPRSARRARGACSRSCSRRAPLEAEAPPPRAAAATLPAPWAIKVVVLNGSGDIVYTRSRREPGPGALVPRHARRKASSFNYPQTAGVLPAGRRGDRPAAREAARRPGAAAPGRHRPAAARRDRRAAARPRQLASTQRDPQRRELLP